MRLVLVSLHEALVSSAGKPLAILSLALVRDRADGLHVGPLAKSTIFSAYKGYSCGVHSRLETVRHLAAALGKLCHDLLVQPYVHFRRAIDRARVAEFLGQLFASPEAAVQFQQ